MAVNRFYKPQRRQIQSAFYTPNIDAWAKLIDKKDAEADELFASADALEQLVPEAGYALQQDRANFLQNVTKQKDQILNKLYDTNDIVGARRAIRSLASKVTSDPRLTRYKEDFELKPAVAKMMYHQTKDQNVYTNQWFNPQTGQVQQTDATTWNPGYYGMVESQDLHSWFLSKSDIIKDKMTAISGMGGELTYEPITDGQGNAVIGEDGKPAYQYVYKGKNVTIKEQSVQNLMRYLDPDGQLGDYAKSVYEGAMGPERAYFDALHEGLTEEQKANKFYEMLFNTSLGRVYRNEEIVEFIKPVGGRTKDSGSDTAAPKPMIGSTQVQIGIQFDKLNSDPAYVINSARTLKRGLNDPERYSKELNKANAILSKNGIEAQLSYNTTTHKVEFSGGIDMNALDVGQRNAIYGTQLDGYANVQDFINQANNIALREQTELNIYQDFLEGFGLDDLEVQRMTEGYTKAAQEDALNDYLNQGLSGKEAFAEYQRRLDAHGGVFDYNEFVKTLKPSDQKVLNDLYETRLDQQYDKTTDERLKNARTELKKAKNKIHQRKVNAYYVFGGDTKSKTLVEGMEGFLSNIVRNETVEMKNPYTDEIITNEDVREAILQNLSEMTTLEQGERFSSRYGQNFQVFFDPEESTYKLLVDLKGGNTKEVQGVTGGVSRIEIPIDGQATIYNGADGSSQSLVKALGIEGDESLLSDLELLQEQFTNPNVGTAVLEGGESGNRYYVKQDPVRALKTGTLTSRLEIKSPSGYQFSLEVSDPREAAKIKQLIDGPFGLSQMSSNEEGIGYARQVILSSSDVPSLHALDNNTDQGPNRLNQFIETFIGTSLMSLENIPGINPNYANMEVSRKLGTKFSAFVQDLYDEGIEVVPTSAKDYDHTELPGASPTSKHLVGDAIDLRVTKELSDALMKRHNENTSRKITELTHGVTFKVNGLYFRYESKGVDAPHFHVTKG